MTDITKNSVVTDRRGGKGVDHRRDGRETGDSSKQGNEKVTLKVTHYNSGLGRSLGNRTCAAAFKSTRTSFAIPKRRRRIQKYCHAKMIFRRVTTWLRSKLAAPPRVAASTDRSALDLDEFARLLCSGDPSDLKQIARDFSSSDRAALWRQLKDRASNRRVQKLTRNE
jgi:hypothetical protein